MAEEALKEKVEGFRFIVDKLQISAVYREKEKIYLNNKAEKTTGYKSEEIKTVQEWFKKLHGKHATDIKKLYDYDRSQGFPDPRKMEILTKTGETRLIEFFVYDEQEHAIWIMHDITEKTKTERALIESEKKFRSYIENAPDGIFLADEKGNYILVNDAACTLTGFTTEELLQKNIKDLVYSDDISRGLKHFRTVVEHGKASGEIRFVTKSGQIKYFIVKAVKLDEKNFLGFTVDITERKLMEEKLKSTYIKLESLWSIASMTDADIKTISDHILSSITKMTGSKYGFYGFINEDESVMTIHSWSGNAMKDCSITDKPSLFPVEEAGIWGEAIRKRKPFILNDYNEYGEIKKGLPEGHVKITRMLVVPFFFQGKITSVAAVANRHMPYTHEDITQITSFLSSIQAVVEHKKSEEFLSLIADILDEAPGSITVHDFTGSFIYANRKTFEIHGYNKEEFMALRVEDIDVPESKAMFEERAEKINRYGEASFDVCHLRKDGTLIPLAIFARKITWKNIPAILSIATDITERKAAEEEKEKLRSQLIQAQKMESIGRLAGGVAHDFNNMLGIILGFTELALEDIEPEHSLYESLKGIEKAANRSADLTRQLLAFARKQTIAPRVLDINDTVSGMLKMVRRLIGEDINLIWMPGAKLWPVLIDPAQLDQIIANLCVNARDAIKGVGKITILTENITFDTNLNVYNADFKAGEYVKISVIDDGCGMEKDVKEHLFEPFFTTKEIGKGTGLGLATVYGIVRQNNGFINVYSEPGMGSTFKIYLPRFYGKNIKASDVKKEGGIQKGSETILLVEDEHDMMNMIKIMLERLGYMVLTAGTPGEALKIAENYSGTIHMLITDVVMPEMNGTDLAKKLLSVYGDIKCLFMSGYTSSVLTHTTIIEEGILFIEKPFTIRELAEKIRKAMEQDRRH